MFSPASSHRPKICMWGGNLKECNLPLPCDSWDRLQEDVGLDGCLMTQLQHCYVILSCTESRKLLKYLFYFIIFKLLFTFGNVTRIWPKIKQKQLFSCIPQSDFRSSAEYKLRYYTQWTISSQSFMPAFRKRAVSSLHKGAWVTRAWVLS